MATPAEVMPVAMHPSRVSGNRFAEAFDLMGAGSVFSQINAVFRCIEIAEQESERLAQLHPAQREALRAAFPDLMPGGLAGMHDALYRSHARELLQRVVNGEDVMLGTNAEALLALHKSSLRAPLTSAAAACFEGLFTQIFGEAARARTARGAVPMSEPWTGAAKEFLQELRRKLRRQRRQEGVK